MGKEKNPNGSLQKGEDGEAVQSSDVSIEAADKPSKVRVLITNDEKNAMWTYLLEQLDTFSTGKIERARDGPLRIKFWEEFRKKTGSSRGALAFRNCYESYFTPLITTSGLDLETQVRMCYAYEVRLKDDYLAMLRENANVRVNSQNVIVEYSKTDGLQFGRVEWRRLTDAEDDTMVNYLMKDVEKNKLRKDILKPGTMMYWKKFIEETGSKREAATLQDRYNVRIAPMLHSATIGTHRLVKLHYALSIPVNESFLYLLRQDADVVVDKAGRIISYKERVKGGLELTDTPNTSEGRQTARRSEALLFSDRENYDMWQYVFQSVHNPETQMAEKNKVRVDKKQFWEGYKEEYHSDKTTAQCLDHYLSHLVPNLHIVEIGTKTKLELYYALDIPVEKTFLEKKGKKLVVDEQRRILVHPYAKANDIPLVQEKTVQSMNSDPGMAAVFGKKHGKDPVVVKLENLEPENNEVTRREPTESVEKKKIKRKQTRVDTFSEKDNGKIWDYIIEKIRNTRAGGDRSGRAVNVESLDFWDELLKTVQMQKDRQACVHHFNTNMSPFIHLAPFCNQTKVNLYRALQVPVNRDFLEILRKTSDVQLDFDGCIVSCTKKNTTVQQQPEKQNQAPVNGKRKPNETSGDVSLNAKKRVKQEPIDEDIPTSSSKDRNGQDVRDLLTTLVSSNSNLIRVVTQIQKNQKQSELPTSTGKSLKQYLEMLKTFVGVLGEPLLSEIEAQLNTMIQNLGTGDVLIPPETIRLAMANNLAALPKFLPRVD